MNEIKWDDGRDVTKPVDEGGDPVPGDGVLILETELFWRVLLLHTELLLLNTIMKDVFYSENLVTLVLMTDSLRLLRIRLVCSWIFLSCLPLISWLSVSSEEMKQSQTRRPSPSLRIPYKGQNIFSFLNSLI